jgi:hypothetical protein
MYFLINSEQNMFFSHDAGATFSYSARMAIFVVFGTEGKGGYLFTPSL